jgi:hypothetical protein
VKDNHSIVRCARAHSNQNLHTSVSWFREMLYKFDNLPDGPRNTLRRYLRKDQICASCLTRCELNGAANKYSGKVPYGSAIWTGCKFGSWAVSYGGVPCWACSGIHPTLAFSPTQASLKKSTTRPGRVCIGREGYIRLCQHKTVTWAEVEKLMVERRGDGPGYPDTMAGRAPATAVAEGPHSTWTSRGPSFGGDRVLRCQDCSHGCSSSPPYLDTSWDQLIQGLHSSSASALLEARLPSASVFDQMVLQFEAHKLMSISNGKPDSLQMRSLFDEIREISPSWTAPDGTPGSLSLPEMRSVDPTICDCVSYTNTKTQTGTDSELAPCQASSGPFIRHDVELGRTLLSVQACLAHRMSALCAAEPRPQASRVCVRVTFTRVISLQQIDALTYCRRSHPPFHPTHDWFDALDPVSYTFNHIAKNLGNRWPSCKNPDCRNNSLSRSTSACPDAEKPCHKKWPLERRCG